MSDYAKLEGEKRTEGGAISGDFVHEHQTMGTAEGFKNVSKRWLDTTISYDDGLKKLSEERQQCHDFMATIAEMHPAVNEAGEFGFRYEKEGKFYKPTEHAAKQVAIKAECSTWATSELLTNPVNAKGQQKFSRDRQDSETLVTVLNNGFRRLPQKKEFLWRTMNNGTLRAMLTDQYRTVDNQWYIESLQKIIPGGRLSHWGSDPHTIFGNVLIPDSIREEQDSEYGGMISCSNSEIGERRIGCKPSLFRAICQNGCIWGQVAGSEIKQVHRGSFSLEWLFGEMKKVIDKQIPLIPTILKTFLGTKAKGWDGADIRPLFAQIALNEKFNKKICTDLLSSYAEESKLTPEYNKSLFTVVNSVTRTARSKTLELPPLEWVRLETVGGRLAEMNDRSWEALTGRAKTLTVDEVEKCFA